MKAAAKFDSIRKYLNTARKRLKTQFFETSKSTQGSTNQIQMQYMLRD